MSNEEKDLVIYNMIKLLMRGPNGMTEEEAVAFLNGVCETLPKEEV